MDISAGNVIGALVPLLAIAAAWGSIKARIERTETDVKALSEKVEVRLKEFQASREAQGERIGEVEKDIARLHERSSAAPDAPAPTRRRRLTKPSGES